ncbi:polygalacturonase-like [Salvia hispanica]|uniref:polygalacturonase-like n=1 Tax=Salvia hispanica TaxID=49212 RepID=UPI002008FFEC|nr:polygalacturonase-like [Salvia hispanica]
MCNANNLLKLLIVYVCLSPICTNSLHHYDDDDDDFPNHLFQQELGYDLGGYPLYISHAELTIQIQPWNSDTRRVAKTANVVDFGAKGDGKSDDTKAFQSAWKSACSSKEDVTFVVPNYKKFLLKPSRFSGPCKSNITIKIGGTIIASDNRADYSKDRRHWIIFHGVDNLVVGGGGTINGNGNIWWKNSCKIDKSKPCKVAPTALTFYECTNLEVKHLRIENGQQIHVSIESCRDVEVSRIVVNAPEKSPNTDGIHVADTQDIMISNCIIATGDDCISIVSGSKNIQATDISCGPGHGISIGSLGAGNSEAHVSDVVVNRVNFSGTTNGVRIKTWQGGYGSASNIKFQNAQMHNVKNPIIIDQNYCDQDDPCKQQKSAVKISNVLYQNIKGTSATEVAVDFECSKSHPCQEIVVDNVRLGGTNGGKSKAVCKNIHLKSIGTVSPHCP